VSLKIILESIEAQSGGVGLRLDCGEGKLVQCGISINALRDLIAFHRVESTETKSLQVLLPEIERLANVKYDTGRFEEDGGILIQSADILRFGFQARKERAA
jgi:hypothetical protein